MREGLDKPFENAIILFILLARSFILHSSIQLEVLFFNVRFQRNTSFRHTFATRAHRAGVDDKTLQTMGGWKDLSTMKNIYIHTQDEDLEIARRILTSSTP